MMKISRFLGAVLGCMLIIGTLGGCNMGGLLSKDAKDYLKDTDTTAIAVSHDGIITESIVDKESDSDYPADDLNDFVKNEIDGFNGENGADAIKLESCDVKDGEIRIVLTYDSYQSYAKYHDVQMFYGSIKEAKTAGIALPEQLIGSDGKSADFETATSEGTGLQILMFEEPVTAYVDGEVTYTSDNAKAASKQKITVNDDAADKDQATTKAPVYVIMK